MHNDYKFYPLGQIVTIFINFAMPCLDPSQSGPWNVNVTSYKERLGMVVGTFSKYSTSHLHLFNTFI